MRILKSTAEAERVAHQKGFAIVSLGGSFKLLPADKSCKHFGFARYNGRRGLDTRTNFYARVRASEEEWTAFFAEVRAHALTRRLAEHQFNDELSTSPPNSGQFSDLLMQQQQKRLDALDFDPNLLQREIANRRPIVRGDVLMHSSEDNDGYRMKRKRLERSDNSPFFLQWPMLCEFATFWGRDDHILKRFPWGADPCGVTHPDPEHGFIGWELVEPYEAQTVKKVPVPEVRYERPAPTAVVESPKESVAATTTATQLAETSTVALPTTEFTALQLLLLYGEEFLGKLGAVSGEDDLLVFAQTLRPAAETLLKKLAERDVVAPSIPSLADLIKAAEVSAGNSARAEELQQQSRKLEQRESELASLAEKLEAKERELNQLLEMIEESADEIFASGRQELLQLQAQTRAEAARLDEFRQSLLRSFDQ